MSISTIDLDPVKPCDPRPELQGWCPGKDICTCHRCGKRFTGARGAYVCADCAYAEQAATPRPTPFNLAELSHKTTRVSESPILTLEIRATLDQVAAALDACEGLLRDAQPTATADWKLRVLREIAL